MLKLLRNICIWMCSTSCLFGYVTLAVPLEYFDDHEFSYDMDTAQSKVKYDPRLLSQQLKEQHNYPQERAAPCYSSTNKYTHGQRVSREDPCEVCLCVDGEIFCWWKKCGNPKRRKFKLEKSTKLGKSKKDKTIDRTHKDQQQLHLKQKKKLEKKKLRQQHWQQQQQRQLQQHPGVRNKILTFPENLPSVLYYDYKTEDQHGFQHRNQQKPAVSSADGGDGLGGYRNNVRTSVNGIGMVRNSISSSTESDVGDEADTASLGEAAESTSTEMKFIARSHPTAEANKKLSLQQTSTARITTTTIAEVGAAVVGPAAEPLSNDHTEVDRLNNNNQLTNDHHVDDMQMLNIDAASRRTSGDSNILQQNHTTTQGETTFLLTQAQEIDHDGILRGAGGASIGVTHDKYPTYSSNKLNNNNNKEQAKGVGTSFRNSFNDFSSEFNASAAMDLDLIMGHHSAHDASIILEANSILNASSPSLLLLKHEAGNGSSTNANTKRVDRPPSVLSTTMVTSTTDNQEQECIVMGESYKIGAILPQETGNCLQCICIEGATKDDTPRVTCSPHNCPPLVLPDLFDATGY